MIPPTPHPLRRVYRRRAGTILVLVLLACGTGALPAHAIQYPGFLDMITDPIPVYPIPPMNEPLYRLPMLDPVFGTRITRISGDTGTSIGTLGSVWGDIVRHNYSTQAAFNSATLLLALDNDGDGIPIVHLNAVNYQPKYGPCANYDRYDWRWHPTLAHHNEHINVNRDGTELMWFDVAECEKTRSWILPIVADRLGMSKGNPSNDGRYVVVANDSQMVVVDMDPQPPHAPYPNQRFGPIYTFATDSLDVYAPDSGKVSWAGISPSGKYIDVKYKSQNQVGWTDCDSLCDVHRIFRVNEDLSIEVQNMPDTALRCGSFVARPNGWLFPAKHTDMALDPFDDNEDVIMGGRACPGSDLGRVLKIRMRDGKVTALSNPVNEAGFSHASARNLLRPGWVYVSYSSNPTFVGRRFYGEVVAYKMDGSGEVQRFAHYRSSQSHFEAETHPVPSPDGKRIVIASDWCIGGMVPCPDPDRVKAYVIDARLNAALDVPEEPPTGASHEIQLSPPRPNPTRDGMFVRVTLPSSRPAALEVHDVAGRRVAIHNVGVLGPGEHTLELDAERKLPTGVYVITLTDGRHLRSAKAVVIR